MVRVPRRPLVAGNWKMNGLRSSTAEFSRIVEGARKLAAVDLMICPPATLLVLFAAAAKGAPVLIGAQDCHAEREDQRALAVVGTQLDGSVPDGATAENLVVAYEPVWAIGSGLTPTPSDVAQMHAFIRQRLGLRLGEEGQGIRILYGGSVKPSNAKELMHVANVDGALVGGASLKADEFLAIASVYGQQSRNIG